MVKGWGKYCSADCRTEGQRKGKIVICTICAKTTYKSPLSLKRSKSHKYFCSKKCQTIWRNEIIFERKNYSNWKFGKSAYRRILKKSGKAEVCSFCQINDKRVLMVHYYDKNRKNNNLGNLVWLCINCHYLVHHYFDEKDKLDKVFKG